MIERKPNLNEQRESRSETSPLGLHIGPGQRDHLIEFGRLASLVNSSDDAIICQTFEGVVTDWNAGAERLFGYRSNEVIGKSMFSSIVPSDRKAELLEALQRVQNGEQVDHFETVRVSKDGRSIPVSIRISPIRDPSGQVYGASAIDRDISQRQAAERRRNARLAVTQILAQEKSIETTVAEILSALCNASEMSAGCFWRLQSDQHTLHCQAFWQEASGTIEGFRDATMRLVFKPGSSLPGRVWTSGHAVWNPNVVDDPEFVRAPQAKQAGLRGGFAFPVTAGKSFLGIIECFSREMQQPDDDLLETITTIGGQVGQFIERRQAEQELRRSEQELSDFFENAAVGLHWVGPDGTILRVNQAELDLLGYTREEYVGHHIAEFHVDQPVIEDILQRLTAGEQLHNFEARLRCKDGSIKHVFIDSNVRWEDGQFLHTRCFTRDISARKRAEASLYDSKERLRLALDAGRMGTWEWNVMTGEVTWSSTLEKIHGLPSGGFLGTFEAFQQDIHPEDRQRVLDLIAQTVEEGKDHQMEYRIVWPDGSVHWLEGCGKTYRDSFGQPIRVVGICSDITERKRLDQELLQQLSEVADAEARISSVVDNVIDGIISIDERGVVASFNPAAERIFGYQASEVIGQNVRLLMPEPYHNEHDGYLANYQRTHIAKIIGIGREVSGKRKDGSTFPMDLAVSEFSFAKQNYFTGIVRDITDRKRNEQSLRFLAEASKSLSSLVDFKSTLQMVAKLAVPGFADWCAVDLLDKDNSLQRLAVAHVDPAKVELADELHRRYPPDPNAPQGLTHVLRTGEPELVTEICDEMLQAGAQDDEHLRIMRALDLKSYMCVPLTAKGKTHGVITFVSAESGRFYRADDLSLAEDLAHRASIAIENARLYQEVREADRRKDEFLAMLAHELRNPLAPIRSGLDVLAMDAGSHQETVSLMQEQVEHVVRLVDDLLDVSRIMRGRVELRKEPVELSVVVKRSVEAVRSRTGNLQHQIDVSLPDQSIWLHADPVRLFQVIENLLHNAVKYTDAGGHIELIAARQNGNASITVRDNGIGIDGELLPRVFDLFTQSDRSLDRSQGGLGIGLTLVKRLVELHDGTVSAHSAGPGRGSTFVVQLPVVAAAAKSIRPVERPRVARECRILVVDDNVGAARMLAMLLMKLGDHTVETAHDGPSALENIKTNHPAIVLLDIGLPGMDGYQVGRAVRESHEFDDVRLIALTGYGTEEDRQRSKAAGFDKHLVKPVGISELQAVLDEFAPETS